MAFFQKLWFAFYIIRLYCDNVTGSQLCEWAIVHWTSTYAHV